MVTGKELETFWERLAERGDVKDFLLSLQIDPDEAGAYSMIKGIDWYEKYAKVKTEDGRIVSPSIERAFAGAMLDGLCLGLFIGSQYENDKTIRAELSD